MRLRLWIYGALLPLFIALGAVNAALYYWLTMREVSWGVEQGARGAVLTAAGLMPLFQATGGDLATALARWSAHLDGTTLARYGHGASERGGPVVLHEFPGLAPAPPPDANLLARLRSGEVVVRTTEVSDANYGRFEAYAEQVSGPERGSVLAVSGRDSALRDQRVIALNVAVVTISICFLLGMLLAEVVTRMTLGDLRPITEFARRMVARRSSSQVIQSRIEELNDLAGTLRTMSSVLSEAADSMRRGLFQGMPFVGARQLSSQWRGDLPAQIRGRGRYRYRIDFLGAANGHFATEVAARDNEVRVIFGRVDGTTDESGIDRQLRADALALALEAHAQSQYARQLRIFGCTKAYLIEFSDQGVRVGPMDETGRCHSAEAKPQGAVAIGASAAITIIDSFVNHYRHEALPQLDPLLRNLDVSEPGVVISYAPLAAGQNDD